jgi:UDP-glucose 4-epimerase
MGFIGGRVATHLSSYGHEVVIASRAKYDPPAWLPKAQMLQLNWNDESNLREACTHIDVVIHAAGMNSGDCEKNPRAALEFNGLATQRLVQASVIAKVKTFVYLSTAHVYARPLAGFITETTIPKNHHPYATSHLAGEKAVLSASKEGDIDGIVLRFSNIYGAPTNKDVNCWMLLVNDLCKQATTTQRIILRSSGSQQRNFLSMSDACTVIRSILVDEFEIGIPKILNVGAVESESIKDMANLIKKRCTKVLGTSPVIEYLPDNLEQDNSILNYGSNYAPLILGKIENDRDREIDALLKFCDDSFSQKLE